MTRQPHMSFRLTPRAYTSTPWAILSAIQERIPICGAAKLSRSPASSFHYYLVNYNLCICFYFWIVVLFLPTYTYITADHVQIQWAGLEH